MFCPLTLHESLYLQWASAGLFQTTSRCTCATTGKRHESWITIWHLYMFHWSPTKDCSSFFCFYFSFSSCEFFFLRHCSGRRFIVEAGMSHSLSTNNSHLKKGGGCVCGNTAVPLNLLYPVSLVFLFFFVFFPPFFLPGRVWTESRRQKKKTSHREIPGVIFNFYVAHRGGFCKVQSFPDAVSVLSVGEEMRWIKKKKKKQTWTKLNLQGKSLPCHLIGPRDFLFTFKVFYVICQKTQTLGWAAAFQGNQVKWWLTMLFKSLFLTLI